MSLAFWNGESMSFIIDCVDLSTNIGINVGHSKYDNGGLSSPPVSCFPSPDQVHLQLTPSSSHFSYQSPYPPPHRESTSIAYLALLEHSSRHLPKLAPLAFIWRGRKQIGHRLSASSSMEHFP
ncbi:hypothetical protein OROHE_023058 [Orobanche hederae]